MKKLLIALIFLCGQKSNAQTTVNISTFGGVADGTTDNYYPFKQAAAYAATHPYTTINFSTGTYYIDKYRQEDDDTTNHIIWQSCIGLKLIGTTGTIISMNGTFFRPLDYFTAECATKSYTTGLCPFWFKDCRNVEIKNMEVKGNVQNTTRAAGVDENNPSVTEGSGSGIRLTKCDTVLIDNMYIHHFESDGLTISDARVMGVIVNSNHITVEDSRFYNNGRQGISVGGCQNGLFSRCKVKFTGFTEGTYGYNDPACGVDIEPGDAGFTDNNTFEDCVFEGNLGGEFVCSYPSTTSNVTLLRDTFLVTGNEKPRALTLLGRYTGVFYCFMDLGNRDFKLTNIAKPGSTITLENNTIQSTGNWITTNTTSLLDSVIIRNNQFNYIGTVMSSTFLSLQTTNLRLLNNSIYIPSAALLSRSTGYHVLVQNAIISSGNNFHSENPSIDPRVDYTGTITVAD